MILKLHDARLLKALMDKMREDLGDENNREEPAACRKHMIRSSSLYIIGFWVLIGLANILSGCQHNQVSDDKAVSTSSAGQPAHEPPQDMVFIKGATYRMGTDDGMNYEKPAHEVNVKSFWIDSHEVTVDGFSRFVEATGYKTEAERFGWSGVFDMKAREWKRVDGAYWHFPEGPDAMPAQSNEPVTQISWNDAAQYAKWAGKRLPTESEWEYSARGGLAGKEYAWGDELRPDGKPVANWWQGRFPEKNTGEDGFIGRAPIKSFAPNGYGLYDVAGNVWEWCADWYANDYYVNSAKDNPTGPANGEERVMRGGSWMCSENYCSNYRVAGRSHSTPDTGLNNLGFRCVRDAATGNE